MIGYAQSDDPLNKIGVELEGGGDGVVVVTPSDMSDFKMHGMKISAEAKMDLFREAGRRQANGLVGSDFGSVPISDLIHEALSKKLGFKIERPEQGPIKEEQLSFLLRMPKKIRNELEKESARRRSLGQSQSSMNAIITEAIESFRSTFPKE